MNTAEVIKTVNDRCPNTCTDEEKIAYVNEIENIVQRELLNLEEKDMKRQVTSDTQTEELLLEKPFDLIYIYYVAAMTCQAMEEWDSFNAWLSLYNSRAVDARNYYITKSNRYKNLKIKNYF